MALLLPLSTIPDTLKNNSYAESKIINLINDLPKDKTKDWLIYYSYYFKGRSNKYSKHNTYIKNHNEIDFLILAPKVGFFVFEIKGGIISYNPTLGFMQMNRFTKQQFKIDPYNQAKENYYGINDIIGKVYFKNRCKYLSFDKFIGGTLVGFPDIQTIPNVGLQSDMIDTFVSGMDLYEFIMKNSIMHINRNDYKIIPEIEDVEVIKKSLLGNNFIYSMGPKEYLKSVNLRLSNLTLEQMTIFKGLLQNKRCLVEGKAGSGKTILCEFLYKHLSLEENKSVLYLTKNKLIKSKILHDLDDIKNSSCFTLKELEKDNSNIKYDSIIIDEAQDLNNDAKLIELLDSKVKGGFKDGVCYLFFDDNQRIIKRKHNKLFENEIFYDNYYRYTLFTLFINCRNSKGIKDTINSLETLDSKMSLKDKKSLIENDNVKYYESNSYIDITKSIIRLINDLNNKEIKNKSITLLFNSNIKLKDNKILNELTKFFKEDLIKYKYKNEDKLTYSTVTKFKGLENDIIIYINDYDDKKLEDHYVALSRAKALVFIFKLI